LPRNAGRATTRDGHPAGQPIDIESFEIYTCGRAERREPIGLKLTRTAKVVGRPVGASSQPPSGSRGRRSRKTILTERNQEQIAEAMRESTRLTHPIQRLGVLDDVAGGSVLV
jgi:hypothetical protein